jgi:hypothetical protein
MVQRGMLDILIAHFSLVPSTHHSHFQDDSDLHVSAAESIFPRPVWINLVCGMLPVVLRREASVNRRLFHWFLGTGAKDDGVRDLPPGTFVLLAKSLSQMLEETRNELEPPPVPGSPEAAALVDDNGARRPGVFFCFFSATANFFFF